MPDSITALMPLTSGGVDYGNHYRQLACGPVVAANHVNAANNSVVPSLSSLVSGTVCWLTLSLTLTLTLAPAPSPQA